MTNTVGTINVLEALRHVNSVKAAVIITSDKCYENVEWEFGYRETDRLGGKDPYSASKACAELAFSSYFRTYLQFKPDFMMASARAGNVIGGGDWAKGRIITDCINAWTNKNQLLLKNPHSTRPWQHVMEPLSGYLSLAQKLLERRPNMNGESFNFGPKTDVTQSVLELIVQMQKNLPTLEYKVQEQNSGYKNEAQLLKLSCDRAYSRLGWQATLSFEETVELTASWYQQWHNKAVIEAFTISQINNYCELAKSRGLPWT
jgi:CDP-glucose 4,6-dehydratase